MKNNLSILILTAMVSITTQVTSAKADSLHFGDFDPKIQGLTEAACDRLNSLGGELMGEISKTSIDLQKAPADSKQTFKTVVENPYTSLKMQLFDLCYSIDWRTEPDQAVSPVDPNASGSYQK